MSRLAGHIFDAYDDVEGRVIRSIAPSFNDLPDFVKTAARLPESAGDDRYALILVDGGSKFRKYATIDAGNTALSVMYLLKQAHLLPPTAVKIAALNLIGACERHGLDIPVQLKMASKTGISPVSGKSQKAYVDGAKVSKIQFPPTEVPKETTSNPLLGKHDAANADVSQRTNMTGVQGTNYLEIPPFSTKEHTKTANPHPGHKWDGKGWVPATEQEVQHAISQGKNYNGPQIIRPMMKTAAPEGAMVVEKQKSWRESPYVDMSGWDPAQAAAFENAPAKLTLIDGNYAVDGYDQVKTASAYFEENWREFHPRKRHDYCVKLAARMESLGMEIPEDVSRYGSTTFAADVDSYVEARRSYAHEEYHPALDLLLEKRAQVSPSTFAEALAEFDDTSGLRWHWDAQVADPWMSTFGPSLEKLAEENWCWDQDGSRIDLAGLKDLALNHKHELCKQFGKAFVDEFAKNPKSVFESLPLPNKKVMARMVDQKIEGI